MALIRTGSTSVKGVLSNAGDQFSNFPSGNKFVNGTQIGTSTNTGWLPVILVNVEGYNTLTAYAASGWSAIGYIDENDTTGTSLTVGTTVNISAYKYLYIIDFAGADNKHWNLS